MINEVPKWQQSQPIENTEKEKMADGREIQFEKWGGVSCKTRNIGRSLGKGGRRQWKPLVPSDLVRCARGLPNKKQEKKLSRKACSRRGGNTLSQDECALKNSGRPARPGNAALSEKKRTKRGGYIAQLGEISSRKDPRGGTILEGNRMI